MNERIKSLWIEALIRGEYSQTRERLHDENGYCCLGVLCDLFIRETGQGQWLDDGPFDKVFTTDVDVSSTDELIQKYHEENLTGNLFGRVRLPSMVMKWAEIPLIQESILTELMRLNDGDREPHGSIVQNIFRKSNSFVEIAEVIGKKL